MISAENIVKKYIKLWSFLIIEAYTVTFDGIGPHKNGDISKGHCS
jgi:hypothetical protein